MSKTNNMNKVLEIVRKETLPALGCTEPVAVAYAVSFAKKYLDEEIDELNIKVSKNIFKNGKSVIIPNTGERGLDLAGGLGAICGKPEDELMVLKDVDENSIYKVHNILGEGKIKVEYIKDSPDIYVEVRAKSKNKDVKVILKDSHNHIESVEVNGKIVYNNSLEKEEGSASFLKELSFEEIIHIVETVPIEEIKFIEAGIKMNKEAAELGMVERKGMGLGFCLKELSEEGQVSIQPLTPYGKRIRAIPEEWTSSFGKQFYLHELSLAALESQSEDDWKLRLEGQLFRTGKKVAVTEFDDLKQYIKQALNGVTPQEAYHE